MRSDEYKKGYLTSRFRNRLFSFIVDEFERCEKEDGLTTAILCKRLGVDEGSGLIALIGHPGDLDLDKLSDLLFAITGGELIDFKVSDPLKFRDE